MDFYYFSFYCFINLCNLFYYLFLLYCVSNTISPEKTQNFLINAGWATLTLYHASKIKVKLFVNNKLDKYLSNEIKELINKKPLIELERTYYIKDNVETCQLLNDSDMVITYFNNLKNDENIIPVIRSEEADSFTSSLIENKYCSYKFITIILIINIDNKMNTIPLDLSKPYNFYIEGNIILDKLFIKWYCKKYYNLDINEDKYAIELFDQNAQYIYFTKDYELFLNKDSYEFRKFSFKKVLDSNIDNLGEKDINIKEYDEADKIDSDNEVQSLKLRKLNFDINLEK